MLKRLERILRSDSIYGVDINHPNMNVELDRRDAILLESLYRGGASLATANTAVNAASLRNKSDLAYGSLARRRGRAMKP
jgi:hypothetical protein